MPCEDKVEMEVGDIATNVIDGVANPLEDAEEPMSEAKHSTKFVRSWGLGWKLGCLEVYFNIELFVAD